MAELLSFLFFPWLEKVENGENRAARSRKERIEHRRIDKSTRLCPRSEKFHHQLLLVGGEMGPYFPELASLSLSSSLSPLFFPVSAAQLTAHLVVAHSLSSVVIDLHKLYWRGLQLSHTNTNWHACCPT